MNKDKRLRIAYILLTSKKPMTTKEIADVAECDRKTVYRAIDSLEVAGFCTKVIKNKANRECNRHLIALTAEKEGGRWSY